MFIKVAPSAPAKEDQERNINFKFLRGLFNDVHLLLVLGGIYPGDRNANSSKKRPCCSWVTKAYVGICLIFWFGQASVFSYAIYNRAMESQRVSRLIIYLIILSLNIHVSVFVSYIMPSEMPKLRDTFMKYAELYGLNIRAGAMFWKMKITTTILILTTVLSSPVLMYAILYVSGTMCDMYPLCAVKGYWEYAAFTFNTIMFFTTTMQWQGYYLVSVYFSLFLFNEFKVINRKFQKLTSSLPDQAETRIKEIMDHHDALVDVLNDTNNCVRHYNFIYLFFALPVNCSMIYAIISRADAIADIVMCISVSLSVSTIAVRLLLDGCVSQELYLFVNGMTAENIGFSIYGFLTINLPSVLAIFGTFATYVIIVVQFHPTDVMSQCEILMKNITECVRP